MTAISVDWFLAFRYHMRDMRFHIMTTKRAIYTSTGLWFVCTLLSYLSSWNSTSVSQAIDIAVSIAICYTISSFFYIRIYKLVRYHQLQNAEHNLNVAHLKKGALKTFI